MVDEPAAGKRFSRDLRQIREERGISIDDIHSKTRIARTLIESFEEGRLYSHESYNRVYLRSFVRAYAEAVEIPVQRALDGLDAALEGTYEGGLSEEYAHSPPESEESEGQSASSPAPSEEEDGVSSAPSAGGPEGRGGIVGPPRAVGEEAEDDGSSTLHDSSPESDSEQEGSRQSSTPSEEDSAVDDDEDLSPRTSPSSEGQSSEEFASSGSDEPPRDEGSEDDSPSWLDEEGGEEESEGGASPASFSQQDETVGTPADAPSADVGGGGIVGEPTPLGSSSEEEPSLDRPGQESPSDRPRSSQSSGWFSGNRREMYLSGVGLLVVIAVGGVLGFLYFSTGSSASQDASTASAVSDSAAASSPVDTTTTEEPERPPPANLTLGETLHLTVRATANVSNLRIRRDDDLRRPYWIQEGDANVFPFEQQALLQNELGDIELFLEGYPYPMPDDTTGGIEITRSQVAAFADTLRGPPASLSVSPDTIPVGAPAE